MENRQLFLLLVLFEVLIPCYGYSQKRSNLNSSSIHAGLGILPVPQEVSFTGSSFQINDKWTLKSGGNISTGEPAVQTLIDGFKERANLEISSKTLFKTNNSQRQIIRLTIRPGSVQIGQATDTNQATLIKQAYQLKLNATEITINANASAGLFYGVQTLLQLLTSENEQVFLPEGEIKDWPGLELRIIYWDCAHHLDRLETFKRAIRQAAYFKINAIALKLEGHFQFKSAKPVVEPFAFTPAEYQELTDYGKAYYVQLIPYLDAPAHVSFILKHPEYFSLRAFPFSNYELCVTDPKTDVLLSGMFGDLMDANQGGQYILFSTDEAYYVGKSEKEKESAKTLGGNGKLLAEFITRISNNLHDKGRTVIIWAEYPLNSSDINALPSHLVNGVYNEKWAPSFRQQGIRQLIYTSVQGVEPLFPNYYTRSEKIPLPLNPKLEITDDERQQGDISKGRVGEALKTIYTSVAGGKSDFLGVIVAAWGDSGLHPETFWLGYATGTAAGWNQTPTSAQELTDRFYLSFYGTKIFKMNRVYELLCNQVAFWDNSWEWEPSKQRTPIIGNSGGIYDIPKPARDQTLPVLPVPSGKDLSLDKDWSGSNSRRLQSAEEFLKENDELVDLLNRNLKNVDYQYNLQILLSVALLCRQNLNMLLDLQRIDKLLKLSSNVASTNPTAAVSFIDQALDQVKLIHALRNESLKSLTALWYQDWYPRVAEANGRKFLDQADDIKDHLPVRTIDMSYLIYREIHYPLGKWAEDVRNVRNQFAKENALPLRSDVPDWESYK